MTGRLYRNDPTILGWELADAPLVMNSAGAYRQWALHTSALIKEFDPNHLVTIGSAGLGVQSDVEEQVSYGTEHAGPFIDFSTFQMWPHAWGWHMLEGARE